MFCSPWMPTQMEMVPRSLSEGAPIVAQAIHNTHTGNIQGHYATMALMKEMQGTMQAGLSGLSQVRGG